MKSLIQVPDNEVGQYQISFVKSSSIRIIHEVNLL